VLVRAVLTDDYWLTWWQDSHGRQAAQLAGAHHPVITGFIPAWRGMRVGGEWQCGRRKGEYMGASE
jgi:hypothetical protein